MDTIRPVLCDELAEQKSHFKKIHEDISALREDIRALRRQWDPDRLLDLDETADLLGVSRRTVDTLVAAGEIPSLKVRRCRRIPRKALSAYIARRAEVSR